jgi:hypothetical protein
MPAKHQYIDIKIPKTLTKQERKEIADLIIERIVDRTLDSKDKDGKPFKKYSDEYIKSLDFNNAGKTPSKVNLTLSGDMLAALMLLQDKGDKLRIGFKKGTEENARADGNIRGTYGQKKENEDKARNFLGISSGELKDILKLVVTDER